VGRPSGTRSKQHEARRREIIARLASRLAQPGAMHASFRDLAAASGESISTLQHYFGRRSDILTAIFAESGRMGAPHLDRTRSPVEGFAESVRDLVDYARMGFEQFGVGDIYAIALVEGIRNAEVAPAVLNDLLDPSIDAIAARLASHQERGEMRPDMVPRHAAVMLLSPIILTMLHQHDLGGRVTNPIDMDRFIDDHVASFVRAHAAP